MKISKFDNAVFEKGDKVKILSLRYGNGDIIEGHEAVGCIGEIVKVFKEGKKAKKHSDREGEPIYWKYKVAVDTGWGTRTCWAISEDMELVE